MGITNKYLLPIIYSSVLDYLLSRFFADIMYLDVKVHDYKILTNNLYKDKDWLVQVFGKTFGQKVKYDVFFLLVDCKNNPNI